LVIQSTRRPTLTHGVKVTPAVASPEGPAPQDIRRFGPRNHGVGRGLKMRSREPDRV